MKKHKSILKSVEKAATYTILYIAFIAGLSESTRSLAVVLILFAGALFLQQIYEELVLIRSNLEKSKNEDI